MCVDLRWKMKKRKRKKKVCPQSDLMCTSVIATDIVQYEEQKWEVEIRKKNGGEDERKVGRREEEWVTYTYISTERIREREKKNERDREREWERERESQLEYIEEMGLLLHDPPILGTGFCLWLHSLWSTSGFLFSSSRSRYRHSEVELFPRQGQLW